MLFAPAVSHNLYAVVGNPMDRSIGQWDVLKIDAGIAVLREVGKSKLNTPIASLSTTGTSSYLLIP